MTGFSARELNALSATLALENERRKYRRLHDFTIGAWPIIEPGTQFRDNWHLQAIGDHLEQVSAGNIRLLIINIPPRHMKSISTSVSWTPWEWGPNQSPSSRFLYSSYAGNLSIRDSLRSRRIIQSDWYQRLWGHIFQLSGDQNAKIRYENDVTGYRISSSVGGIGTGEGGKYIVTDDPHSVTEAESEAVREGTVDWWSKAMSTRLDDPETGTHVIVMQRVHEKDVSGYELAERAQDFSGKTGDCVHLCLPARFEEKRRCVTYVRGVEFFRDPRSTEGELLWADRFNDRAIRVLEKKLGEYGTAGQLQQLPAPAEGGLFKLKHLKLWPRSDKLPLFRYVVQSYDTAFTDQTANDPTGHIAFGVFQLNGKWKVMFLEAWDEHLSYSELRRRVKKEFKDSRYGEDDTAARADIVLIENKGSGISVQQDMRLSGVPAIPYNPGKADKTARAQASLPYWEDGYFYAMESSNSKGEFVSWMLPVLRQLMYFPNAEHDEYVDCLTQTVRHLRDIGYLDLDEKEETEEVDYAKRKPKPNPYAS